MAKFSWWWMPFVFFMACGALIGFWIGSAFSDSVNEVYAKRAELRDACIAGNDRACRVYEVDRGR